MSLLARLAGTDEARPAAQPPVRTAEGAAHEALAARPSVHGSMLARFGAPVLQVRSR